MCASSTEVIVLGTTNVSTPTQVRFSVGKFYYRWSKTGDGRVIFGRLGIAGFRILPVTGVDHQALPGDPIIQSMILSQLGLT